MNLAEQIIKSGKKVIVFGAGAWGIRFLWENNISPECFVDNDRKKQNQYIGNIPVYEPGYLKTIDSESTIIVIANEKHSHEMRKQLNDIWAGEIAEYRINKNLSDEDSGFFDNMRYNVVYRCNSHCKTCSIWKHKGGEELSPVDFERILSDPAYAKMKRLYITGGEPTLRKDFSQYIKVAVEKLNHVSFINTVTNAVLEDRTVDIMMKCNEICRMHDVPFSVSVSLDGTEKVHDEIRGVLGGFRHAVSTIKRLKEAGVDCSVSVTISALNAWNLERYKSVLRQLGCNAFFKKTQVIEFFDKALLPKEPFVFTEDINHQIILFLYKVIKESADTFNQMVAYNTIAMMQGKKRMLGCGYIESDNNEQDAFLMQDGTYLLCADSNTGSVKLNADNAVSAYTDLKNKTDFFPFTKCEECSGDTFSFPGREMIEEIDNTNYWKAYLSKEGFEKYFPDFKPYEANIREDQNDNVVILGKIGTEDVVVGKALRNYIEEYKEKEECKVTVCSEYVFHTKRFISGLSGVFVEPVYDRLFIPRILKAREVIIFGDEVCGSAVWGVKLAEKYGIKTTYVSELNLQEKNFVEIIDKKPEICCCIDADMKISECAMKQAARIAEAKGIICRFYSVNNFCYAKYGDNRDTYFALIEKTFGENWEKKAWIDEKLADFEKLSKAMQTFEYVIAIGKGPEKLAEKIGATTVRCDG